MILCVRTTPPMSRKTQRLGSPLKNAASRGSRGNEAHISSEKAALREPPHVGCYFLNRLLVKDSFSQPIAGERVTNLRTTSSKTDEFERLCRSSQTERPRWAYREPP